MAQDITITLSNEQVAEMQEVINILHPGSTNAEKLEWGGAIAKNGLRTEVARLKAQVIRQQENENRKTELDEFNAAWAVEPDPLAPDEADG